ncbi:hypothetical protein [Streptomyces sp. MUSC 14]|uniref:hypothetical protein n=1 Tax=Streptomyces sp. MUSC 14 TaxID=1354889 RepID=UPI00210A1B28|nr:hypothetical protein [Streptomyces sp. MUSC 14]
MDGLHECTGEWPSSDTVDILSGWFSRFSFAVREDATPQVTGRAWVLRRQDRHSDEVSLFCDEASALASLARHARSCWDNVAGTDGIPYLPPDDDQAAVDLYYGPKEDRSDEDYTLYAGGISRYARPASRLSLSDAQTCAQANSAAVFHPQENPDDEGLPCIEIAGILVFAYLDADREAVRVSVHLDTPDQRLVQADGTVPIQVEVEDDTVFSTLTTPPAPAEATGWKALVRRLTRRTVVHDAGKLQQWVDPHDRYTII